MDLVAVWKLVYFMLKSSNFSESTSYWRSYHGNHVNTMQPTLIFLRRSIMSLISSQISCPWSHLSLPPPPPPGKRCGCQERGLVKEGFFKRWLLNCLVIAPIIGPEMRSSKKSAVFYTEKPFLSRTLVFIWNQWQCFVVVESPENENMHFPKFLQI